MKIEHLAQSFSQSIKTSTKQSNRNRKIVLKYGHIFIKTKMNTENNIKIKIIKQTNINTFDKNNSNKKSCKTRFTSSDYNVDMTYH